VFIFVLQIRELSRGHPEALLLFGVLSLWVWSMWAYKVMISRRYRPWTAPHETTASVIIPVVDEPLDLFRDVLQRIIKQDPDEIIVVINGRRNPDLEQVCDEAGVDWTWTVTPGKRNAVRIGVDMATAEIAVLVDSDTLWTDDTLTELLKPFAERNVGGVTTKQRILEPRRSFLTRWADWMESSRIHYSMPAQSALGHVGCLPGRTIAFRRSILEWVMPDFLEARFLGVHLEVSDDRHLTNLTLKEGFRTVYQSTSLVYTDAPTKIGKLFRQQLRWARGSQYNHLRMLPWAFGHAPMLIPFFITDIALPFLLLGCIMSWVWRAAHDTGVNLTSPLLQAVPGFAGWLLVGGLVVFGSTLSMWLRQHRHLQEVPRDLLWMPAYVIFSSLFLMPVRLLGFIRMAHTAGWGTRSGAYTRQRRRLNPQALIPYLLAVSLIGAELAVITRF
jgi:hyaluronan synthase